MVYFSFKGHFDASHPGAEAFRVLGGHPVLLSRTGYTGEMGFELFMEAGRFLPQGPFLRLRQRGDAAGPGNQRYPRRESLQDSGDDR